jgi:hypothetical protein
MNQLVSIPADFKMDEYTRERVASLMNDQRAAIIDCQHKLSAAGLPGDLAASLAADIFVRLGCEMALDVAMEMHGRDPSRDRWVQICGDTFDQVLTAYSGAMHI